MAVFRVERNTGYTVMSNHHLRNKELSLKAKGLLSQMLSLPEDWDYTLAGLSHINREKIDAIREAVKELEKAGYIVRSRERDEKGPLAGRRLRHIRAAAARESRKQLPAADSRLYWIYLHWKIQHWISNVGKTYAEKPTLENPTQLNKDILSKEQSITDLSSTDSIPFHSLNPLPFAHGEAATPPERKRTEAKSNSAVEIYRRLSRTISNTTISFKTAKLTKTVWTRLLTLCWKPSAQPERQSVLHGDDYPAELVKSKF